MTQEQILESLDQEYQVLVNTKKEEANIVIKNMEARNFEAELESLKLKNNEDPVKHIAGDMLPHIRCVMMFPDKNVFKLLKLLGCRRTLQKWFVPLENIAKEFEKIEAAGININKAAALDAIQIFLEYKFEADFIQDLTPLAHDDGMTSRLWKDLWNLKKRKRGKNGEFKTMNSYDTFLLKLVKLYDKQPDDFKEVINEPDALSYLMEAAKGKVENFTIGLMLDNHFIGIRKVKTRVAKYVACFNLLKMIMQDRILHTEKEHLKLTNNRSYRNYLSRTLNSWLYNSGKNPSQKGAKTKQ